MREYVPGSQAVGKLGDIVGMAVGYFEGWRVKIGALEGPGVGPVGATVGANVGRVVFREGADVAAIGIQTDWPVPLVVIPRADETQV